MRERYYVHPLTSRGHACHVGCPAAAAAHRAHVRNPLLL